MGESKWHSRVLVVEGGHSHRWVQLNIQTLTTAMATAVTRSSEGWRCQETHEALLSSGSLCGTPRSCPPSHLEAVLFSAPGDNLGETHIDGCRTLPSMEPRPPGASI